MPPSPWDIARARPETWCKLDEECSAPSGAVPVRAEQVPLVPPGYGPRNTAQPLSALADSRILARNVSDPPNNRTTSGCPPPSRRQRNRSSLHTQYKDSLEKPPGGCFWVDVAQIARHHGSRANADVMPGPNRADLGAFKLQLAARPRVGHIGPQRSCGRVAEGGGLLNRYRVVKPYRGFESLRLRHPLPCGLRVASHPKTTGRRVSPEAPQERRETVALVVRLFSRAKQWRHLCRFDE